MPQFNGRSQGAFSSCAEGRLGEEVVIAKDNGPLLRLVPRRPRRPEEAGLRERADLDGARLRPDPEDFGEYVR